VAERQVLEGDRRRLAERSAEEGPETDHEDRRGTPASGTASEPGLYRISSGGTSGWTS
jgi:hypothetical protein